MERVTLCAPRHRRATIPMIMEIIIKDIREKARGQEEGRIARQIRHCMRAVEHGAGSLCGRVKQRGWVRGERRIEIAHHISEHGVEKLKWIRKCKFARVSMTGKRIRKGGIAEEGIKVGTRWGVRTMRRIGRTAATSLLGAIR